MTALTTGALASAQTLTPAAWDLRNFFTNASKYTEEVGGGLLILLGTAGVVWGGVLLIKKLMSNQDQTSWLKIIGLIIIGGALMASGFTLISQIAKGGETTIKELGGGVLLPALFALAA